ncbi:MAG: MlaD family protein [Verrucomicrobiales bacterium]|nr:MlaD family protein [Verrucomicrobiales bacterium]
MKTRNVELSVGILGVVGLLTIGGFILVFGKLGDRFKGTYELVVEISDATGIRQGVPVRLGGIPVGYVSELPKLKEDFSGMELPLSIFDDVKIPKNSIVSIGTTGLMGDSFIKITLPPTLTGEYIDPDSVLPITESGGLATLQSDAVGILSNMGETLTEINRTIRNLDRTFEKIDYLTSSENLQSLSTTMQNLSESTAKINSAADNLEPLMTTAGESFDDIRKTSENLRAASDRVDPVISNADSTLAEIRETANVAKDAFGSANADVDSGIKSLEQIAATLSKADPGLDQLEGALDQLRRTLSHADTFAADLENSEGLLKELRDNPKFKQDFIDLICKLEKKGFVFYPREKTPSKIPERTFDNPKIPGRR